MLNTIPLDLQQITKHLVSEKMSEEAEKLAIEYKSSENGTSESSQNTLKPTLDLSIPLDHLGPVIINEVNQHI